MDDYKQEERGICNRTKDKPKANKAKDEVDVNQNEENAPVETKLEAHPDMSNEVIISAETQVDGSNETQKKDGEEKKKKKKKKKKEDPQVQNDENNRIAEVFEGSWEDEEDKKKKAKREEAKRLKKEEEEKKKKKKDEDPFGAQKDDSQKNPKMKKSRFEKHENSPYNNSHKAEGLSTPLTDDPLRGGRKKSSVSKEMKKIRPEERTSHEEKSLATKQKVTELRGARANKLSAKKQQNQTDSSEKQEKKKLKVSKLSKSRSFSKIKKMPMSQRNIKSRNMGDRSIEQVKTKPVVEKKKQGNNYLDNLKEYDFKKHFAFMKGLIVNGGSSSGSSQSATSNATLNKSKVLTKKLDGDDSFIANGEDDMGCDVMAEYTVDDSGPQPDVQHKNNENGGQLFVKGIPFWSVKEGKAPESNNVVMTIALKELEDGKWVMCDKVKEPSDLDPFHDFDTMKARDKKFYGKEKQVLSNTARSCAYLIQSREVFKEMRTTPVAAKSPVKIKFVIPKTSTTYNKKMRTEPVSVNFFTPGLVPKQRINKTKFRYSVEGAKKKP